MLSDDLAAFDDEFTLDVRVVEAAQPVGREPDGVGIHVEPDTLAGTGTDQGELHPPVAAADLEDTPAADVETAAEETPEGSTGIRSSLKSLFPFAAVADVEGLREPEEAAAHGPERDAGALTKAKPGCN